MGFRLIRKNSKDYEEKIRQLMSHALEEETKRWLNLTSLRDGTEQRFIDRFKSLQHPGTNRAKEAHALEEAILSKAANIAKIQGNLEIERVSSLLEADETKAKT